MNTRSTGHCAVHTDHRLDLAYGLERDSSRREKTRGRQKQQGYNKATKHVTVTQEALPVIAKAVVAKVVTLYHFVIIGI